MDDLTEMLKGVLEGAVLQVLARGSNHGYEIVRALNQVRAEAGLKPVKMSPSLRSAARGLSVSMLGDDGVRYYGSHFSAIDESVRPGVRVAAGTRLGLVGRTGNANNTCHLHLGISPPCASTGDWWIRRGVIWPWSYLDAWKAGTSRSPVAEIQAWHQAHGCPPEPKN